MSCCPPADVVGVRTGSPRAECTGPILCVRLVSLILAPSQHGSCLPTSQSSFSGWTVSRSLQHLQRLSQYGCRWKSLTQEYLDSTGPLGDAIVALLAALAQQERETIRARINAGLDRARKEGKRLGRPRKVFDRQKALRLRRKGLSIRAIAQELAVSHATVHRTLRAA